MKWHMQYAGRAWVFDNLRITAAEARIQKAVCGLPVTEADTQRLRLDPDPWVAALLIAMRRDGHEVDGQKITRENAALVVAGLDLDDFDLGRIDEDSRAAEIASVPLATADDPAPAAVDPPAEVAPADPPA